jgi:hypothetical protein
MSCRAELRNPCRNAVHVVTQAMGVRYRVKPVVELVTQITGKLSYQKLSSINRFHFENLQCLLIIVRSGPLLMLNDFETFREMHERFANEMI